MRTISEDVVDTARCVVVLKNDGTMLTIQSDHGRVLETGSDTVYAVTFHPDGIYVFVGATNGIRRWRIADAQEAGKQTGMTVNAISVSMDQKWIVCGTMSGASVWDAELREKLVEVERGDISAVDIAPDCTRFATAPWSGHSRASIWNITTGKRLVGPLKHGDYVKGVKFSPDGRRIVVACRDSSTLIFDSHNGDQLVSIENSLPGYSPMLPIAWSTDGQLLFVISKGNKIKSSDSSTGSQLDEWRIHENDDAHTALALSANNKFIVSCAGRFVSFWDASTHTQLGIVEDTERIWSIALSPDGRRLASGSYDSGRITIQDLSGILPESYLAINVSTRFLRSWKIAFIHHYLFWCACKILVGPEPRM